MRGAQLARQWKIIRLLESCKRGLSAKEISEELGEDRRTIYRDLDAIQEAGFPLYTDKVGKNVYWKLLDGHKSGLDIPFTLTELMSLHMSRDILRIFEGTVFQESIETLFGKVKASLSPETVRFLEQIAGTLKVGFSPHKDYKSFKDLIARASDAASQRKRVEISYRAASTGRVTVRQVDPYQVWAMNGSLYLTGLCHVRNAVRTFAVDRIKSLVVLEQSFNPPKDFSLEHYLQAAFRVMTGNPMTVKVRFAPGAAHVVRERIWHPTQEIREQSDGSLVVTLQVSINYEVISWILGFGQAAEVLEPDDLRQRILDELVAAAKTYRGPAAQNRAVTKKIPARVS